MIEKIFYLIDKTVSPDIPKPIPSPIQRYWFSVKATIAISSQCMLSLLTLKKQRIECVHCARGTEFLTIPYNFPRFFC